jgi:hypothetical protein
MELLSFKQGLFIGIEMGIIIGVMIATIVLRKFLE